ncbi:MAG: hypothetical protein K8J08_10890 [Thermoanaerobaculia bacterium]|nr:hypothetical protein [Thermoanaerobaculia bacterium]
MPLEIIGEIEHEEVIASGRSIRELSRLLKVYGEGRWRKLKGVGLVRLPNGSVIRAEIHWYEAHGQSRKEAKIKRILGLP